MLAPLAADTTNCEVDPAEISSGSPPRVGDPAFVQCAPRSSLTYTVLSTLPAAPFPAHSSARPFGLVTASAAGTIIPSALQGAAWVTVLIPPLAVTITVAPSSTAATRA